jgi:hypothetical protein
MSFLLPTWSYLPGPLLEGAVLVSSTPNAPGLLSARCFDLTEGGDT